MIVGNYFIKRVEKMSGEMKYEIYDKKIQTK